MPEINCITAPCNPSSASETFTDFVKRFPFGNSTEAATMELRCPPEGCPKPALNPADRLGNAIAGMKWLALGVAAIFVLIVLSSRR